MKFKNGIAAGCMICTNVILYIFEKSLKIYVAIDDSDEFSCISWASFVGLLSEISMYLLLIPGSTTQPWTGAPTGTTLIVDLVHATMMQCVPPNHPRRQQQPLQTVEPWPTARSLGTGTFQTLTIVASTTTA